MSHLDKAFEMLQGASDAQLRRLYAKKAAPVQPEVEEQPSEDDLLLLEQSLNAPQG